MLDTDSLMTSPGRQHFTHVVTIQHRGIKYILCDSIGRGLLKACSLFPLDFTPWDFLHADFPLYSLDVISHIYEYDYMLSPVSLLSESLNLGVVLGTPDTNLFRFSISFWVNLSSLCLSRNLSFSSRLSNLLSYNCLQYSLIILFISVRSVVMPSLFFLF